MTLQESVVLIKSSDPGNPRFGTGFVIHRDDAATYVLTCAHVVNDVGGDGKILADNHAAAVAASGDSKGIDLAVLCAEKFTDRPLLHLRNAGETGRSFATAGFQKHTNNRLLMRPLQGEIGNLLSLSSGGEERIKAWDLRIIDEHTLEPGYSGSPVFDENLSCVVGVVSDRQGKGERGVAIAIENLDQIWQPPKSRKKTPQLGSGVHKMCDRNNQDNDFLALFELETDEGSRPPQFYFVHGEDGECHESFIKRLEQTHLREYVEKRQGEENASVYSKVVEWSYRKDLETCKNDLKFNLMKVFGKPKKISDFSASVLSRMSSLDKRLLVVVIHNIYASKWHSHNEELIIRYVTKFCQSSVMRSPL